MIRRAHIRLARGAGEDVIAHELLHALGLEHTCVVPSIMATEFPDTALHACGERRALLRWREPLRLVRESTAYDALALELLAAFNAARGAWRGDSIHTFIVES